MIKRAEVMQELPTENAGWSKYCCSNHVSLSRILIYDTQHQLGGGGVILNLADAHTCYDLMKHTEISISWQSIKLRQTILAMLLTTTQQLYFHLRKWYIEYVSYYRGECGSIFQG